MDLYTSIVEILKDKASKSDSLLSLEKYDLTQGSSFLNMNVGKHLGQIELKYDMTGLSFNLNVGKIQTGVTTITSPLIITEDSIKSNVKLLASNVIFSDRTTILSNLSTESLNVNQESIFHSYITVLSNLNIKIGASCSINIKPNASELINVIVK